MAENARIERLIKLEAEKLAAEAKKKEEIRLLEEQNAKIEQQLLIDAETERLRLENEKIE